MEIQMIGQTKVGCNQHSFDNKLNFKPPRNQQYENNALLKKYHNQKPVLSYFLSTLYYSDQKNQTDSWYDVINTLLSLIT